MPNIKGSKRGSYKPPKTIDKVLKSLEKHLGNVSEACKENNIGRCTFYEWKKTNKEFDKKVNEICEAQIDLVESQLIENIKIGKEASIIFYLKTKGKTRGYTEQDFQNQDDNAKLINIITELLKSS